MRLLSNKNYNLKNGDLILIAVVLVVSGITAFLINKQKVGDRVVIVSGSSESEYSLDEDKEIRINAENGGYNIVVISDKEVWVSEADCSNQICVHHKHISKNHQSIACVPHGLSIVIQSDSSNEIDN